MAKTAFEDKTEKSAGLTFFSKEQIICPICNTQVRNVCPTCHRPLNADWKVCPYCRTRIQQ